MMFLNPRPTPEAVAAWYGSDYFENRIDSGRGYATYLSKSEVWELALAATEKLKLVSEHIALEGASILEVGCATGETCHVAADMGARAIGCDVSVDAIHTARSRYPEVGFCCTTAEMLPFEAESFDIILAFELIEHLLSPSAFLREVHRLLDKSSVLAITTPNAKCGRMLGWGQWSGFLTSFEHLYFFDTHSLTTILTDNGMTVVGIYSIGDGRMAQRERLAKVKRLLRRVGLFDIAKTLHRRATARRSYSWTSSDEFHTLMVIARKS
jgi:2-polyprenyl-3-methyl-5-hydroxy-6-metoxy-1,4-benzoquinol methylase